jgi:hypothetical protein
MPLLPEHCRESAQSNGGDRKLPGWLPKDAAPVHSVTVRQPSDAIAGWAAGQPCFAPKAEFRIADTMIRSKQFDHFIGAGEQRRGDVET